MIGPMLWALLWFVAAVGGLLLAAFLFILIGVACGSLPGLGLGSVLLECPHWRPADAVAPPEWQTVRRSFREEVAERQTHASTRRSGDDRCLPIAKLT